VEAVRRKRGKPWEVVSAPTRASPHSLWSGAACRVHIWGAHACRLQCLCVRFSSWVPRCPTVTEGAGWRTTHLEHPVQWSPKVGHRELLQLRGRSARRCHLSATWGCANERRVEAKRGVSDAGCPVHTMIRPRRASARRARCVAAGAEVTSRRAVEPSSALRRSGATRAVGRAREEVTGATENAAVLTPALATQRMPWLCSNAYNVPLRY
jgi:hypothetical protein